jgi:soluble lytic murein transglycosylase-like protein
MIFCLSLGFLSYTQALEIKPLGLRTLCENTEHIFNASKIHKLDPFVLTALIYNESRGIPNLESSAGACGLTQVIPKYVRGVSCRDLFKPKKSIYVGAKSLSYWLELKNQSMHKALQCYSTGFKCSYKSYAKRILRISKKIKTAHNFIKRILHE